MNIGLFIDISNLYYCCNKKYNGKKIDYHKLLQFVSTKIGTVVRATVYGAQRELEAQPFITCLKHLGFETQYKQPKIIHVGNRDIQRVDWHVGITLDVVRTIERLDTVVICSSDTEFVGLIEFVKERGLAGYVMSCGVPKDLKRVATHWQEIGEDLLE